MHLIVSILLNSFLILRIVLGQELTVTRYADGDVFSIEGSCTDACAVLSSGTAGPFLRHPLTAGLHIPDSSCTCQCNLEVPVFREDLHICVNDIQECSVAGFINSSGKIEKVPYVFLPQRGQIIYPQAEISFEGVKLPVCGITGAQQLGKGGWIELRNLSSPEPPFRLYNEGGKTYLQWIGETGLRDASEGKLVVTKLVCRDAFPGSTHPQVFTPCVSFRVAGSPSKNSVKEVTFFSNSKSQQRLSTIEYTAIGISSILLALIYIASVSLYLHSRKTKKKSLEAPEVTLTGGRRGAGLVKNNPLLGTSRHFESDSALSESDLGDDLPQSDGEPRFENVHITSAVVHPHCNYFETNEGACGSGSILGERIPEEDVRIVETVDNTYYHDAPVLPGSQRRKLYFNPAYFDRQLLLAPPPAAIEFLLKIREVIVIAKHKMNAKKFVPSLGKIPEEESVSEHCSSSNKQKASSSRSSMARSKKSRRCSGCPGCMEPRLNLQTLPENTKPIPGESRVRAWLEDVKPPERRWKNPEDEGKYFQENARTFARSLDYLKEITNNYDLKNTDKKNLPTKPFSSWKNNPPMLKTFRHIARSEILENEDKNSISQRSTKSMFEEPVFDKLQRKLKDGFTSFDLHEHSEINAKVRKAIENSFIKQMEENAALEKKLNEKPMIDTNAYVKTMKASNPDKPEKEISERVAPYKQPRKSKAPSVPKKLPDMKNEFSNGNNTAKRIMDKVIREMVDVKALEPCLKSPNIYEYEVDSLERSKTKERQKRKSSTSSESMNQSSPTLSTALPMDEELTMQNAIINAKTGEVTLSKMEKEVRKKDYYNLPEIVSQKEKYSLVSEVYVNDGYTSPTGSDDSGPEIQYEPENPGHLTIKVQDSPQNYIKLDESEYEPDTLDRKPMKLKINGDVDYEKDAPNEVFVDSLERPSQILLRSKGSFKEEDLAKNGVAPLHRGYGSLRAIFEARLKGSTTDDVTSNGTRSLSNVPNNVETERTLSWKKNRYLTPDRRQARRQRKPQNQPDLVPMPPPEGIYQHSQESRRLETLESSAFLSKNEWDRSRTRMEDPTASDGAPVPNVNHLFVGTCEGSSNYNCNLLPTWKGQVVNNIVGHSSSSSFLHDIEVFSTKERSSSSQNRFIVNRKDDRTNLIHSRMRTFSNSADQIFTNPLTGLRKSRVQKKTIITNVKQSKTEDSGYLSSTDSNGSRKQLLSHDVSSVSETDETESLGDGASESGAESVGTDSVFFGNFRKLSETANFSKSIDSGVDVEVRNPIFQSLEIRNEGGAIMKSINVSENESKTFSSDLGTLGNSRKSQS